MTKSYNLKKYPNADYTPNDMGPPQVRDDDVETIKDKAISDAYVEEEAEKLADATNDLTP